jgi:hypothetical protein
MGMLRYRRRQRSGGWVHTHDVSKSHTQANMANLLASIFLGQGAWLRGTPLGEKILDGHLTRISLGLGLVFVLGKGLGSKVLPAHVFFFKLY